MSDDAIGQHSAEHVMPLTFLPDGREDRKFGRAHLNTLAGLQTQADLAPR